MPLAVKTSCLFLFDLQEGGEQGRVLLVCVQDEHTPLYQDGPDQPGLCRGLLALTPSAPLVPSPGSGRSGETHFDPGDMVSAGRDPQGLPQPLSPCPAPVRAGQPCRLAEEGVLPVGPAGGAGVQQRVFLLLRRERLEVSHT